LRKETTEREQRLLDQYLDRALRCLEAEEKADNARRRYWAKRGGVEAEMRARFERARKKYLKKKAADESSRGDDPKH
jgi:hypothetical protein